MTLRRCVDALRIRTHERGRLHARTMKPRERELRAAANDMLGQLGPKKVLRDAIDLGLKVARDDVFREYLAARGWVVVGVIFVFLLVSTVCSVDLMFSVARQMSPSPLWLKGFAVIVGATVWAGGLLAQTYVFLLWLEARAARKRREERGIRLEVPGGILAYLKYSRALPPWIVIVVCVGLPLAIMARQAPLVASALALLAIAAPAAYWKLDT